MKRFITLSLITLVLCAGTALLSHASIDKKVVKTELVYHPDILSVAVFETYYIAEPTLEVVPDWIPKVIGNVTDGYSSNVYHPPATTRAKHLFKYSKRF